LQDFEGLEVVAAVVVLDVVVGLVEVGFCVVEGFVGCGVVVVGVVVFCVVLADVVVFGVVEGFVGCGVVVFGVVVSCVVLADVVVPLEESCLGQVVKESFVTVSIQSLASVTLE